MRELSFEVYGRRLAALGWGEAGATPVLALHGWLDNAASFIPLAEKLEGFQLVALDMAGNGQSDHRAADGEYNAWSDLPDIEAVADQLGWEHFVLLGHSRGAIISALYASSRPERIARVALLDAVVPGPVDPAACPQQLASFLADKKRLLDRPGRVFADREDAVAIREKNGLSPVAAKLIAERNLKPVAGGWCWSHDARLQGASAFKQTAAHNRAVLDGLSMPGLLLLAEDGLRRRGELPDLPATLQVKIVPGSHHCHMDESVGEIAAELQSFLHGESA
jgi:pimeloyl-ACP methyl ester carboxylesterase